MKGIILSPRVLAANKEVKYIVRAIDIFLSTRSLIVNIGVVKIYKTKNRPIGRRAYTKARRSYR
jgi:hypothetical protein